MKTNELLEVDKIISLIAVSDNHYLIMLAALIKSVEENHFTSEVINFHVVADKITNENKLKLMSSINPSIIRIIWHEMDQLLKGALRIPKDKSSYPLNIYMRLFFDLFIPKGVKRVLYLDCDMIVLNDISILYNIDLEGFPLGAVQDPKIKNFENEWGGILNYKELGLKGNSLYFNSGMLLIDCQRWAELGVTQKVVQCVEDNTNFINYPDQYGLNVVLSDNWLNIDKRWNSLSATESSTNPFVIHFTERKPIYKSYSNNMEYKEKFYNYLRKTAWHKFEPMTEFSRIRKKFSNVLTKYKPT